MKYHSGAKDSGVSSAWTKASDPEIFAGNFRLSDAQLAIAREYGFASWTRLKRRMEKPRLSDDVTFHIMNGLRIRIPPRSGV